jgi:hypothetical protein
VKPPEPWRKRLIWTRCGRGGAEFLRVVKAVMVAELIVDILLENDFQGPPVPDKFTNAIGSMDDLMALKRKALATMGQLKPALGFERQLRKHGVTRDQVDSYIRAESEYPSRYRFGMASRGALPADAIVGMNLHDGRKIMFDMAILPAEK